MKQHRRGEREHVAFIGMPTSGKTTIGRLLAEYLEWPFVDVDDCIKDYCKVDKLQNVVDAMAREEFAKLEEKIAVKTMRRLSKPTVVATGGSVVYYQRAMEAITKRAYVCHLSAPYEEIERRVERKPSRGITFKPGQTLRDLYDERTPLYKQWADEVIDASSRDERDAIAQMLAKRIRAKLLCR